MEGRKQRHTRKRKGRGGEGRGGRGRGDALTVGMPAECAHPHLDLMPTQQVVEVKGGHVDGVHPIHSHVCPSDAAGVRTPDLEACPAPSPLSAAHLTL